jgi:hypothetical protein
VPFIHRFGPRINAHLHFHYVIIDGVFDAATGGVIFRTATELDANAIADVQAGACRRSQPRDARSLALATTPPSGNFHPATTPDDPAFASTWPSQAVRRCPRSRLEALDLLSVIRIHEKPDPACAAAALAVGSG